VAHWSLGKLMSQEIKLATAPVSWGVDHMGRPDLPPWPVVFDQIAVPNRTLDEILGDATISLVLIHSKSHSLVPLASAALRAGKAVLV